MYIQKRYEAGDYVLVKKHSPIIPSSGGRRAREKPTSESRKKMNDKKRAEKIQLLILANFDMGFHIILDYPKDQRPETYEEAEKNLTKFLHKMSRKYKRQGKKFKYLATTERGQRRAALHHHLICESSPGIVEDIAANWGSHIKIFKMYQDGAYKDLAEYFVKAETKEEVQFGKSRFHRSRNLITPIERTAKRRGSFRQKPRIPKGYRLVEGSLQNGFNETVGIRYQKYLLQRDGPGQQAVKRKQKRKQKCTYRESKKKLASIPSNKKRSRDG